MDHYRSANDVIRIATPETSSRQQCPSASNTAQEDVSTNVVDLLVFLRDCSGANRWAERSSINRSGYRIASKELHSGLQTQWRL